MKKYKIQTITQHFLLGGLMGVILFFVYAVVRHGNLENFHNSLHSRQNDKNCYTLHTNAGHFKFIMYQTPEYKRMKKAFKQDTYSRGEISGIKDYLLQIKQKEQKCIKFNSKRAKNKTNILESGDVIIVLNSESKFCGGIGFFVAHKTQIDTEAFIVGSILEEGILEAKKLIQSGVKKNEVMYIKKCQ